MPGTVQPSDLDRELARLARRVEALEKKLRWGGGADNRMLPGLFSFSGALDATEGVESPAYDFITTVRIKLLRARVLTAPSGGDVDISIDRDGSTVALITIPDGDLTGEYSSPILVSAGQYLTATVTTASGAEDLSISALPQFT